MNCINLRLRSKKNVKYFYCMDKQREISINECYSCLAKEYKKVPKMAVKKPLSQCKKKHKLTIATSIPLEVKKKVWKRDNHKCLFCGKEVPLFNANSHFVKRSHSGLGIEENIFTCCIECHQAFDDSPRRAKMLPIAREYLKSKYPGWNESNLKYKKTRN